MMIIMIMMVTTTTIEGEDGGAAMIMIMTMAAAGDRDDTGACDNDTPANSSYFGRSLRLFHLTAILDPRD